MGFDLKQKLKASLTGWKEKMEKFGVESIYATVAVAALWPVVQAVNAGDPAALGNLINAAGAVGANLWANLLQHWADETDGAKQVANLSPDDPVRAQLDEVLQKLNLMAEARLALSESDRNWFEQTLQNELTRLGNFNRFENQIINTAALVVQGPGPVVNAGPVSMVTQGEISAAGKSIVMAGPNYGQITITHAAPSEKALATTGQGLKSYLKALRRHCEILPLAALGEEEGVEVGLTLDDVYVALDTKTEVPLASEPVHGDRTDPTMRPNRENHPLSALEAVSQSPRLVLLGEPGAGKSTFVNQVLARLAAYRLGSAEVPPIGLSGELFPLLFVLRDLVPRLSVLDVDHRPSAQAGDLLVAAVLEQAKANLERLGVANFANELVETLDTSPLLLVFDGMDEVPFGQHRRVRQALAAVLDRYRPQRVIVTCRIRSYEGEACLSQFAAHTLAPFDDKKIQEFVAAWYRAQKALGRVDADQSQRKTEDLRKAALADDLREMAANPMLLTTMALIHQREVRLPSQRVQLYSLAVEVLARRWQKGKTGELAQFLKDNLRLRAGLERLAYETHLAGKGKGEAGDLLRGTALSLLEQPELLGSPLLAAEFLDYVDQRAGLLVGRGGGSGLPQLYSFPHRTFQEYLAGCHLLAGRDSGKQARTFYHHAAEGTYWSLAARLAMEELRFNIPRGTNQLLDLAYRLCHANLSAGAQAARASLWAGVMAMLAGRDTIERDSESPDGGKAFLDRLMIRLLELLGDHLPAQERAEAGKVLAKLGDPRKGVAPTTMEELGEMEFCYVPPGAFVMGEDKARHRNESLCQGFWIARYPVTVAQFEWFVKAGGYGQPNFWQEAKAAKVWRDGKVKDSWENEWRGRPGNSGEPFTLDNHPVVDLNWYEAVAFCQWLTESWQMKLPAGYALALPSEAEWEKAARGGEQVLTEVRPVRLCDGLSLPATPRLEINPEPERAYPWRGEFNSNRANCGETGIGTTSAVGGFPGGASPCGAREMAGNVWEWTNDGDSGARVLRGGSWNLDRDGVRCACRLRLHPNYRSGNIGFRVVASPFVSGH